MATETIICDPLEVRDEILALGLDAEGLVECVRYAEREWSFVTANDAVGFGSMVIYDKAGRALRDRYLGKDWVKDDTNNQCAIKNPEKGIRVVPCNFDDKAGDRLVTPTNKSPKGEVSRKSSMCNRTAWMPGIPKANPTSEDGFQTWVLGIYVGYERQTSAEISLPTGFEGQRFTDFGKRIVLLSVVDGEGIGLKRVDGADGDAVGVVDIALRRK